MIIDANRKQPLAYIITCRTYATWLHGDERRSVDPKHNKFGTPKIKSNVNFQKHMKKLCKEPAFLMTAPQRQAILQSIINTCQHANWHLYAVHVRSNHAHIVVCAPKKPEQVAITFKAHATRYLKHNFPGLKRTKYWSRGASTGYIFRSECLLRSIQYTVEEQGDEMALYCDPWYYELIESV